MKKQEFSTKVGGKTLIAEFNDLADQANGSVILRCGDTTVLATAVMSKERREGMGFFPLTVDYEEKFYAAGAILGSRYMRREGRPSEEAILSGRVIDRTIRPLFDQSIRNEVQVVITVLSLGEEDPDILAINATSLAIATSDIPWSGPVSAVRVSLQGKGVGESASASPTSDTPSPVKPLDDDAGNAEDFIVNPTYKERDNTDLEITISGKDGKINMLEAGANELSEDTAVAAFDRAIKEIEKFQEFQKNIIKEIGKEKTEVEREELSSEEKKLFEKEISAEVAPSVMSGKAGKASIRSLGKKWSALYEKHFPDGNVSLAARHYEEAVNDILHEYAVMQGKRADGRNLNELRSLYAQAGGISPQLHGSGIFYRGGTHILSALTLGGPRDALILDGMEVRGEKRFIHHYNFPPFSGGETGRIGGTNRRMIGHGALAERALSYVIPPKEEFPYTIRVVSESMASNGSTSMGSVCAATLALMDAGVPIKRPVAGIAMGLMIKDGEYKILTDIQGPEDEHGDMDFKVAGTEKGITALQMDIKVDGIAVNILREALAGAKEARLNILKTIKNAIEKPREDIAPSAPKIITMTVKEDKIGLLIGPGGKTVNKIKDDTNVEEIQIEDDGTVYITGKNGTAEKARDMIFDMTREYRIGEKFKGEVVKLFDFGAIVKINAFTEGLVHISELAPFRIANVSDVVKEGDVIPVVVKEIDDRGIKFSLKDADAEYAKNKGVKPGAAPNSQNGGRVNHTRAKHK